MADSTKVSALLSLVVETFKLAPKLQMEGDKLSQDLDLTSSRWGMLGVVSGADKPLTVADLARRMDLKPQTVQRFTGAMEKKGFISFDDNPDHKRAKLIRLTSRGEETLAVMKERELRWATNVAEGIATEDIEQAIKILAHVRGKITD